jgi:23S rRNA (guanosine2251-2'-O)-methyltransferase
MREFIYGRRPVLECLRARRRHIFGLFLAQGITETGIVEEILEGAAGLKVPVRRVPRPELERISDMHQGMALEVAGYPYASPDAILRKANKLDESPFILALDHLQDPHNLGALLRTAEVVGVHGVVIPGRRAVGVTPAVVSASAGASEHVEVAQVTNLARTLVELKSNGVWVVGLDAGPAAKLYDQVDLDLGLALVVGAEGKGLSRLVRETCDILIRLPMRGKMESLNASVAGGVALYAALRARAFSVD